MWIQSMSQFITGYSETNSDFLHILWQPYDLGANLHCSLWHGAKSNNN